VTDPLRTADVARILGVSPRRVRAMVQAGWCRPERAGRALAFRFQDLVLLRTAHGLAQARVPPRRVKRALSELLRQLPPERPLSGIRISAAGGRVVVRDHDSVWQPESGQLLLDFAVDELARKSGAAQLGHTPPSATGLPAGRSSGNAEEESAADWFERAVDLEDDDPEAARAAYQRALELDPDLGDAYVNLGRLAHQAGDPTTAARCYHLALARDDLDPVTHYNLALALEDLASNSDAVAHYSRAVALNPAFADAHYNLSQLLTRLGRKNEALRHLVRYRQLVRRK
jgi:tetratricopeptide (TPR) repeat protein